MRILFLSIEYPPESPNGIGAYAVEMATALAQRGHEIHVLSCMPGQPERDYRDAAVFIHRRDEAPLPRLARLADRPLTARRLWHARACWREARRLGINFDVIESPDWMAEGLFFAITRRPLVAHVHTPLNITRRFAAMVATQDVRSADWLERLMVARARAITAPSRRVVETLRAQGWLGRRRVEIVRHPMNLDRWADVRPVTETAPIVLFTGRLERLKAPDVLVEAMVSLASTNPEAQALLAGRSAGEVDGRPYGDWLADRIAHLQAPCRILGALPPERVKQLSALARVFVVPSRFDNFPYAGLEALAAGRPVVCTSMTGIAEIVEGSGAGAVIEPGDPNALARAIEPYLADVTVASQAGQKARELLGHVCSPAAIAAQRERVYQQVIDGAG